MLVHAPVTSPSVRRWVPETRPLHPWRTERRLVAVNHSPVYNDVVRHKKYETFLIIPKLLEISIGRLLKYRQDMYTSQYRIKNGSNSAINSRHIIKLSLCNDPNCSLSHLNGKPRTDKDFTTAQTLARTFSQYIFFCFLLIL